MKKSTIATVLGASLVVLGCSEDATLLESRDAAVEVTSCLLLASAPAIGQTNVPRATSELLLKFSAEVAPASLEGAIQYNGEDIATASVTPDDQSTVSVKLSAGFFPGGSYTFIVLAGADGLLCGGAELATESTISFEMEPR